MNTSKFAQPSWKNNFFSQKDSHKPESLGFKAAVETKENTIYSYFGTNFQSHNSLDRLQSH